MGIIAFSKQHKAAAPEAEIAEKHAKVLLNFEEGVDVDPSLLTVFAQIARLQSGYEDSKKLTFRFSSSNQEGFAEATQALHYFIAEAGGKIMSGKPPMTATERVLQGVLTEDF